MGPSHFPATAYPIVSISPWLYCDFHALNAQYSVFVSTLFCSCSALTNPASFFTGHNLPMFSPAPSRVFPILLCLFFIILLSYLPGQSPPSRHLTHHSQTTGNPVDSPFKARPRSTYSPQLLLLPPWAQPPSSPPSASILNMAARTMLQRKSSYIPLLLKIAPFYLMTEVIGHYRKPPRLCHLVPCNPLASSVIIVTQLVSLYSFRSF